MNNPNVNKQKLINSIINASNGKISNNSVEKAANGDLSDLISSLDKDSQEKLRQALSNKQAAQQILSSDAAKQLLQNLMNGGK